MIERSPVYLSRLSVRLLGFLSRRYLGSSAAYGTILHRITAITLNSSVRFSSRWRLCAPSRVSEVSEVSTTLSLKQFNFKCLSDWRWPFLILFKDDSRARSFSMPLSSRRSWCDILGFVPAGSVSSSATLEACQDASHCFGRFSCQPAGLLT